MEDKILYTHGTIVNICLVSELISTLNQFDATLENYLFGAVKLTINADADKYKYSGYGVGFDGKRTFSFPRGGLGSNVIIFGADMSSSVHVDNRN